MDGRVLPLLHQARDAVNQPAGPRTGLEHALLFAVEAALSLAQAWEAVHHGDRAGDDRLHEAYSCARAAVAAARFAVVEAGDGVRARRADVHTNR